MLRITTTLFLFIATFFCFPQDINKLKENNGFRKIKLGTNVLEYPSLVKQSSDNKGYFNPWYDYNYAFDQYTFKGYEKIGDAKIHRIFVKTLDAKIYEIMLVVDKNEGIFELLKIAYGNPNTDDIETGALVWRTDNNIECSVTERCEGSEKLIIRYTDTVLSHMAAEREQADKKKKIISQF